MASAQVHQQTEVAPEHAENKQQLPGPEAMQEDEQGESAVQIQDGQASPLQESAPVNVNEPQGSSLLSESGQSEKQVDVQQPVSENQEQSTGSKEQEAAAAASGASKLPESAKSRAQRLATEAAEAQEAAEHAAKVAAEKQLQALAAAKEAEDEIHAEHEATKKTGLPEVEEVAERASKQQKLSAESSQDTFRDLLQTTAEGSLLKVAKQRGTAPHQSSQSPSGADVPDGDAFESVARQFAVEATETVQQMMETTVKTVADVSSPKPGQEGSQHGEQPTNPTRDDEVPSGPETLIQPGLQMSTKAVEAVPFQPPASTNGIQSHNLVPSAILTQNPRPHTPDLPANAGLDSLQNTTTDFVSKSPEGDIYRTTPENQPSEQGPAPMQVG